MTNIDIQGFPLTCIFVKKNMLEKLPAEPRPRHFRTVNANRFVCYGSMFILVTSGRSV